MFARIRLTLALALLTGAQIASAATFNATRTQDLPDSNPGDGLCQAFPALPGGGQCTLRAAIMEANALGGSHTINLSSGLTYTLTRHGIDDTAVLGDLDILRTMTIQCQNCAERPTINTSGVDRIFDVHTGSLTMRNFDITGGNSLGPNGGAIRAGAGVSELRLTNMRLHGNQAEGNGGAIHTAAALTVLSSIEVFDNITEGRGSAISGSGPGTITLNEVSIYGNQHFGSNFEAVHVSGGGATLRNTTISGNIGLGLSSLNNTLPIVLRNSTIAGNSSGGVDITNAAPNSVQFRNSIIGRNGGIGDCSFTNTSPLADANNLFSDTTCASIAGNSDLLNVDPLLTPLQKRNTNLASTPLHWPSPASPALSSGSLAEFGELACTDADQIGEGRPQGFNGVVRCDIGAAEVPEDAIYFDSMETL